MQAFLILRYVCSRSETEEDEGEVEVGLAAQLGDLKDDIIEAEKAEEAAKEEAVWAQPAMKSEPISKVFIEQKSKPCQKPHGVKFCFYVRI